MYWRYKKLTYDILIPKLGKNISQLNQEEAADYFAWYVEQIPSRVSYVSDICAKELRIPRENLDCTPESLLLIWKWFRLRAKTEPVIKAKGAPKDKSYPDIWSNKRQLTLETEYIIRDIGMYLGETLRKNVPNIYWTYYTTPRRDFFVNHPLLKGFIDTTTGNPFEAVFEPIHMTGVQAAKILSRRSCDADLYNIYNIWAEKV